MAIIDGPITFTDIAVCFCVTIAPVAGIAWAASENLEEPEKSRVFSLIIGGFIFFVCTILAIASAPPVQRSRAESALGIELRDCYALHVDAERKRGTAAMSPDQYRRAGTCFYQRELLTAYITGERPWSWWPSAIFGAISFALAWRALMRSQHKTKR